MTRFSLCSLMLALWLSASHAALRKKNVPIREGKGNRPTSITFNTTKRSTPSDDRKAGTSDPPDFVIVSPPAHIVGGGPANAAAYPFFATSDSLTLCGGALIWPDVILSAGHCIAAFNHPNGKALLGSTTNFGRENPNETIPIKSWLVHPLYRKPGTGNEEADIMLIFLNRTSTAPPARWNVQRSIPSVGQQLTAIGFGNTGDTPGASTLKEGKMQVIK